MGKPHPRQSGRYSSPSGNQGTASTKRSSVKCQANKSLRYPLCTSLFAALPIQRRIVSDALSSDPVFLTSFRGLRRSTIQCGKLYDSEDGSGEGGGQREGKRNGLLLFPKFGGSLEVSG